MAKELQDLIANLRELTEQINRASRLSEEQLQKCSQETHQLFLKAIELARATEDEALAIFLKRTTGILSKLHSISQVDLPNLAKNIPSPDEILHELNAAFGEQIAKKLEEIDPSGKNREKAEQLSGLAKMAHETFNTCTLLVQYHDKMNQDEKIYAIMGAVLMIAGVGCLIAATCNPVTGPALAAITIAGFVMHALGRNLAKKAVERHENVPEGQKIRESLDKMAVEAKELEKKFDARTPKESVTFRDADAAVEACEHRPTATKVPAPEQSISERLTNGIKNAFNSLFGPK